jgi:5-methylcytosine-specific restriction endonuclease McrA
MKRTRIRPIGEKRKAEMEAEYEIRRQLCERAGGYWVRSGHYYRCLGGLCELCHKPPDWRGLSPHENKHRSQGGKLSLENSKMLCGKCHSAEHGIKEVQ